MLAEVVFQLARTGWSTQYRSAIFFHSPEQETQAKARIEQLTNEGKFKPKRIVTKVEPAQTFWRAEEYLQALSRKARAGELPYLNGLSALNPILEDLTRPAASIPPLPRHTSRLPSGSHRARPSDVPSPLRVDDGIARLH